MSACEKCWGDAYIRSMLSGKPQVDCYYDLLEERKANPCTPEEQRGEGYAAPDAGHTGDETE